MTSSQTNHIELLANSLISLRQHFTTNTPSQSASSSDKPSSLIGQQLVVKGTTRENQSESPVSIASDPGFFSGLSEALSSISHAATDTKSRPSASVTTSGKGDKAQFLSGETSDNIARNKESSSRDNLRPVVCTANLSRGFAPQSASTESSTIRELRGCLRELEKTVAAQSERIIALERAQDDRLARFCAGQYLWRICEVHAKRNSGSTSTIHSPGFYTSPFGYHVCVRVNLNGIENGFNRHIALFVHFLQGEFDDSLEWPFKGTITLSILDQRGGTEGGGDSTSVVGGNITESLSCQQGLAAFERPQGHRNHKGFGYKEFAPISILDDERYVRDGTLLIRATARSHDGM